MIFGSDGNGGIPDIGSIMQSTNLYAFVTNNPIMFIDMLGLYRLLSEMVNETTGDIRWQERNMRARVRIDGQTEFFYISGGNVYLNNQRIGHVADNRIMMQESDFNSTFNIVGTLSIAVYVSPDSKSPINGHAWLEYTPLGGATTTYATWPHHNNETGGMYINYPGDRNLMGSLGTSRFSVRITRNQANRFFNAINNPRNDRWSELNNCTHFAVRVFTQATGMVNSFEAITPRVLQQEIRIQNRLRERN